MKKTELEESYYIAMAFNQAAAVLKEVKKLQKLSRGKLETTISSSFVQAIKTAYVDIRTNVKAPNKKSELTLSVTNGGMTTLSDGDSTLSFTMKGESDRKLNRGVKEIENLKFHARTQGILPPLK